MSEETKRPRGWPKGKRFTAEHRKNLSLSHKRIKHNLGKTFSDEWRKNMSLASKGKPKSEAHKKAMSEAAKNSIRLYGPYVTRHKK